MRTGILAQAGVIKKPGSWRYQKPFCKRCYKPLSLQRRFLGFQRY